MSILKSNPDNYPGVANWLPWFLTMLVAFLAIYVWGHSFGWAASAINAYQFFPVLGLMAFSIMWSHYITGALKPLFIPSANLKDYYRLTGYAVLVLIVLHPGILIYQRFRDGYGLPPHSYQSYVAPSVAWVTLLGSVSLLIFLSFELHRFFKDRSWWKYVTGAGDAAMIAIFYHGLRLGSQLQGGWYRYVWLFYGVTLIAAIIYKYIVIYDSGHKLSQS
jgi:hypothetical protein